MLTLTLTVNIPISNLCSHTKQNSLFTQFNHSFITSTKFVNYSRCTLSNDWSLPTFYFTFEQHIISNSKWKIGLDNSAYLRTVTSYMYCDERIESNTYNAKAWKTLQEVYCSFHVKKKILKRIYTVITLSQACTPIYPLLHASVWHTYGQYCSIFNVFDENSAYKLNVLW